MNRLEVDSGNSNSSGKSGGIFWTVFLFLFGLPFAGFGLFAVIQGIKNLSAGDTMNGLGVCLMGLFFSCVGFGLMFAAIWGRKKLKQTAELQARYADKPWLMRPEWAAGRVKSSDFAQTKMAAIMALAFCGIGGLSTFVVLPKELHKGNYPALLILLFPLIGIGFLIAVIRELLARRRFGDCFFDMAAIPGALGGTLEGMIQTGARLRLEHGLHLKLSCIRRVTTGSGKNRSTQEYILWQDEKILKSEADLPEPEPGHTGIPVFFRLPADQPESTAGSGDGIHWRLEAKAKMSGLNFHATFDVPVFKVAGAVVAGETDEPDPTAALQMPVEELRRDEHSKIQVADGPDGREFYFPAARNLGAAFSWIMYALICGGIAVLVFYKCDFLFVSIIFGGIFGLVGALLSCLAFSLLFKSSRVTIASTGVRATNRWLVFSRTRRFPAADIDHFTTFAGMKLGTQVFQDIKLETRTGTKYFVSDPTIASGIASAAEANWLVQEMTKALGRRP